MCPTYCQARRKMRSCSARRTAWSTYQDHGYVWRSSIASSIAPGWLSSLPSRRAGSRRPARPVRRTTTSSPTTRRSRASSRRIRTRCSRSRWRTARRRCSPRAPTASARSATAPSAEIWDAERNPGGRIIRNEDVFPEKVAYYADVIRALRHLPSAVMLAAPDEDAAVRDAVEEVVRSRPPTVTSRDQKGNEHRVRVVSEPPERDRLLASLEGKELLVADGNHRSRASEHAGLDAFFAVVLSAETMHIDEYHRGFRELPMDDDEFLARVREAGFDVGETGTVELFSR